MAAIRENDVSAGAGSGAGGSGEARGGWAEFTVQLSVMISPGLDAAIEREVTRRREHGLPGAVRSAVVRDWLSRSAGIEIGDREGE